MPVITDRILPKEINTDLSFIYLGNDKSSFIRGIDYALFGDGTEMVYKPEESNKLYDTTFTPPAGDNFAVLRKVSKETNEVYVGAYNSNGDHFIYRIKNGKCEYVYRGKELGFVLDPLYFIRAGRIEVVQTKIGNKRKTFLIWTDNKDDQHHLCVEDSIATDSFNDTKFPYFKTKYPKREYILLGLRAFTDCIKIKEVVSTNTGLNKLKYKTWKFRISGYDVYGRLLEHGVISDVFYINDCANDNISCVDLTFDMLSPMVDKIAIEFSNDCGANWKRHALLDKYEPCKGDYWERGLNKELSIKDNKITYRFCPGEQCLAIPSEQTKRNYNDLPIRSSGVIKINNGIALLNNEYGRQPFSCDVLDKIKFTIEKPTPESLTAVTVASRKITVWMIIYNDYVNLAQMVWKQGETNVWGGLTATKEESAVGGDSGYGQHLGEPDADGFIGYLSDGSVTTSKQYRYKYPVILGAGGQGKKEDDWELWGVGQKGDFSNRMFMQKFEFNNVRAGKYIFRIAGHGASLQSDYKRTSTYFAGITGFNSQGIPDAEGFRKDIVGARELLIDVCDKDYNSFESNEVIKILDLTMPDASINLNTEPRVSTGYLYETNDGEKGVNPIANAAVRPSVIKSNKQSDFTDYNGFWWAGVRDKNYVVNIEITHKCKDEKVQVLQWNGEGRGMKSATFFATQKWPDFQKEECNRILLKGRVVDCDTGVGIPAISVAQTNGQFAVTDKEGRYELITYDWNWYMSQVGMVRKDKILFNSSGNCRITNCEGGTCFASLNIAIQSCSCDKRTINFADTKAKFVKRNHGLQLGGRYSFGVGGADWMDRKGFVQAEERWKLDIPTVNDIGGWGFPRVRWDIDSSVTFDPWIERLYFYWGKNLKYTDFQTWVADRIELIDATGNVNSISPTQIRIHYSSLNEYNKQYNYSTNSTWQVIDEKDSLIITDTVHFMANGDYKLFDKNITALVRSDKQGQYFQVDYNSDLKDLKEGAIFKFMREPECEETELFYEVCLSVEVVNGKPVTNFGYLDVYDSYFVDRQIPTPLVTTKKVKTLVAGSTTTYTEIEQSETVNVLRSYGWPFEHHSPSDFWGAKCDNHGRVNAKDDLESIMRKEVEFTMSGAVSENAKINFIHYFGGRVKDFGKEYNSITAAITKGNHVVVICSNKTFMTAFDDTTARMANDGSVRVLSGEQQFSNPQNILNFGCREQDRNVIATDGDVISWVDGTESALVLHNFANGQNVARGRYESTLRRKIKSIDKSNFAAGKIVRFLHGEINLKNGLYIFTDFNIDQREYVNNSFNVEIDKNETFSIDIASGSLRKFAHYTGELYATLPSEEKDKQFFAFKGALPYSHYNNSSSCLNYFGAQCYPMIKVGMAVDPLLFKNHLSIIVHCDNIVLYGKEVITHTKQKSWIPRNFFKRVNKYWIAPFLCDEQSVSVPEKKLTNGEKLRSKGIEILLVGDPDNSDKYFELTAVEINSIKT